jgi:hypothetical protein
MAETLRIYDGQFGQELRVTPRQAIQLEVALNKSEHGTTWKTIGDFLYDYGVGRIFRGNFLVTPAQLVVLNGLFQNL